MKKQFKKIFKKKYSQNSKNFRSLNKQLSVQSDNMYSTYFFNTAFDKGKLKTFVSWFLKNYGQKKTIDLLEDLKNLGFGYATLGGISLGIDDLKIPPNKADLLFRADLEIKSSNFRSTRAELTGVEQFQTLIDTWHQTSETLKQDVIKYFELTDVFNPVYMMAFSGARGNVSQVRQLVGMRGLMADPQGQIIDFPIRSNFREGLTLTEYIISTYGARKGIVDTALRTATAGYLTRRLVDVAQHIIVSQFDCGTSRGIFLFDMKEGLKTIYSFKDRLIGRVLAQDISENLPPNKKIGFRNQEISNDLALSIAKVTKKALVRSPLTCETRRLVCQLCYGWSLSKGSLVSLGEAVGVIAAQSIGEPGTQLTMRTFHTGGVFSGGITDQIIAPDNGIIYYSNPIAGSCIRTPQGGIAFLTKVEGSFLFKSDLNENSVPIEQFYKVPAYTILFVRHEQKVNKKQILAQFSSLSKQQAVQADAEQIIYSKFEGQVYFSNLDLIEQSHEKYGDITWKTDDWAKIWILAGKVYENPVLAHFFPMPGDLITKKTLMNQIQWYTPQSGFIEFESMATNSGLIKTSNLPTSQFLKLEKHHFKMLKNPKNEKLNFFKIKNTKLNVFDFISSSNVSILSKKLMNSTLPLKSNFSDSNKLSTNRKLSCLKNNYSNFESYNFQMIRPKDPLKLVTLKTPFYYPFQKVSFKRLVSFLSYGTQKDFIIKKSQLNFNKFYVEKKSKKSIVKTKLSSFELQEKWQNWIRKTHLPKKIHKKTIQSQLNSRALPYFLSNALGKKTTNRSYVIKFTNSLNQKFINLTNSDYQKIMTNTNSIGQSKLSSIPKFSNNQMTHFKKQICKNKTNEQSSTFEKRQKLISSLNLRNSTQLIKFNKEKNSSFFLKSPLLEFSLNNLNYKKMSYSLLLNEKKKKLFNVTFHNSKPNPKQQKQLNSDFKFTNKIELITYFPLNERFLTNNIKVKNSNSTSVFSQPLKLNTKILEERHVNLKNTFSWSNFPNKFLSWLPEEYQTINNGLFFFLKPAGLIKTNNNLSQGFHFLQKNKKSLKSFQTKKILPLKTLRLLNLPHLDYFQKDKINNQNITISRNTLKTINQFSKLLHSGDFNNKNYVNTSVEKPLQSSAFEKTTYFYKIQISQSLEKHQKIFSDLLTLKVKYQNLLRFDKLLKNSFSISKGSTVEFFKIKSKNSILRWSNKKLITSSEMFERKTYSSKILKYKVSLNEIFWLPEEKYEIINRAIKKQNENSKTLLSSKTNFLDLRNQSNTLTLKNYKNNDYFKKFYFLKSEQPICLILNRQGFKKPILTNLEGFASINSKTYKLKNDKTTISEQGYLSNSYSESKIKTTKSEVQKLELKEQITETLGSTALQNLTLVLKNHLNFAILKSRQNQFKRAKIQNIFKHKIKQKKDDNNCHFSTYFNQLETNKKNYLSIIPIKKRGILHIQEDKKNSHSIKKVLKLQGSNEKISTKQITIKQGWVYLINDFSTSNYLHQSIVEPGIAFLNNVSFDQLRTFVEILPTFCNSNVTKQQKLESTHSFKIKENIFNQKSRFFNSSSISSEFNILILIRPMQYKILRHTETFKRDIIKFNRKCKFSFINLNMFGSSLLNQQNSTGKLVSSFPAPDLKIISKFKLPSGKSTYNEKLLKISKQSKSGPILFPFFLKVKSNSLIQKIETTNQSHVLNIGTSQNRFTSINKVHCFGSFSEYSYYCSQPMNFSPLSIQGSIPSSQYYVFKIPVVKFNASEALNLNFVSSNTFNTEQILKFVNFKNFYLKNIKKCHQNNLNNQKIQNVLPIVPLKINHLKTRSKFYQLLKLQSFNCDFLIPNFDWSYNDKMNYFYNQRFFDYKNNNKIENSTNWSRTEYSQNNLFSDFTHFIPKIENKCFMYPNNKILRTQSLGKTNFISPIEGEILTKQYDTSSIKQQTFAFLDKTTNNHELILTKSDMVTIMFFNFETQREFKQVNLSTIPNKNMDSGPNSNIVWSRVESSLNTKQKDLRQLYQKILKSNQAFYVIDEEFQKLKNLGQFELKDFSLKYHQKLYKINGLKIGHPTNSKDLRLRKFLVSGDPLYLDFTSSKSGQIIHLNKNEVTLRTGEYLSVSPNAILHSYNGDFIKKNTPVMTLPFQTLKTGDIVQGIPKVEQYLEARTTQQGRLFLRSLPVLMQAIFERYSGILPHDKAVRQSFLKIQQILVDGVQRVYRSQGISIADKHLEIIVKQMTSKVQIIFGGQTGLFPGELVDLDFVERLNQRVLIKVYYEPIVLGITRASLEVDSFLSAASFQQTTKILARAAIYKQKDYLKGLKENLLIGNLIPAGTGYITVSKS